MIHKDHNIQMDKICRSCMTESAEMLNIFESKSEAVPLSEMLTACASIKLCENDGLPRLLCVDCKSKLSVAYDFKRQCEKADTKLRELKARNDPFGIKVEAVELQSEVDVAGFDGRDCYESSSEEDIKEKGFKCSYCEKILRSKKGLMVHERRHLGVDDKSDVRLSDGSEGESSGEKEEDEEYECKFCKKVLTTAVGLRIHMRRHTGHNLANCNYCDKTFTKTSHLKRHLRVHGVTNYENALEGHRVEKSKKIMECEFCDRKFKYKKSFNHHMQTEHGMSDESDVPLSAYVTVTHDEPKNDEATENPENDNSKQQENQDQPKDHNDSDMDLVDDTNETKENGKSHVCHVCGCSFARANHLTKHMTLHRAVLFYKCDKCEKAFATVDFLDKHVKEDHIEKPYACTICNRAFGRGEHLIRHLKMHDAGDEGRLKCSVCEKMFSRSEHLAQHIKIHLQQDKRHVCSECGKAFNRLDNLKTHQRIHTGLKDTTRLHLCVYCGKEFNNSSNMIVHMRRHTGERPYKCQECGKGFPRSHDLKCHERTHSGEKPYLCTLCGKSFNKSNKLLRHTRVHTGERPYVCNLCGRAFTQSNDLALHMRRHTGSRPYACAVCPARFIQSGQLKAHKRQTGHWMEHPPELKGGHRVEPVTATVNPVPIKFKLHKKVDERVVVEQEEEGFRIVNQPVGIMGNAGLQEGQSGQGFVIGPEGKLIGIQVGFVREGVKEEMRREEGLQEKRDGEEVQGFGQMSFGFQNFG